MTDQIKLAESLIKDMHLPLIRLNGKIPIEPRWQENPNGTVKLEDLPSIKGNLGVLCGFPIAKDEYLFVIDVDRDRDGYNSLKKLSGTTNLPDTFTVSTGGGGRHLYYVHDEPLPITIDPEGFPGVEFRGKGAQVVAPGSKHASGKTYDITPACPEYIEKAPQKLIDLITNFKNVKPKTSLNGHEKITTARNNYLTIVAGRLRRSGLEQSAITAALLAHDLEHCDPPLQTDKNEKPNGLRQIQTIAKSICKHAPEDAVTGSLTVEKYEPPKVEPKPINSFLGIYKKADGIVGELSRSILESAPRQYPQFAIASALGIVSSVAQGSYLCPNIWFPDESRGNLSLYQVLLAPAAGGKDHYLRSVNKWLDSVDERLIASDFGSVGGMVSGFFAFNNRTSCIDEIQDYFTKLGSQKGSYLDQILTKKKELYNDLEFIKPQQTKSAVFPKIECPKYSIFSVGTVQGYTDHIRGDMIGGGLQSRFIVWPHMKVTGFKPTRKLIIDDDVKIKLTSILCAGKSGGFIFDYEAQLKLISKIGSPRVKDSDEPLFHTPAVKPTRTVPMDKGAQELLIGFIRSQEKKYLDLSNNKDKAGSDMSPASIIDRSSQIATKIACLHALGCSGTVTAKDAQWAIELVTALIPYMVGMVEDNLKGNKDYGRVLATIKNTKGATTMRDLNQKTSIRPMQYLHAIVIDLAYSKEVSIISGDEKVIVDEQAVEKWKGKVPRGYKVVM